MSEVIYQYQQGYVPNNGNTFYFWVDCSKEAYEEEKEEGGTVRKLYTAAPPAVLPPAIGTREAIQRLEQEDIPGSVNVAYKWGYNQCRADAMALGAQPQMVVELPAPEKDGGTDWQGDITAGCVNRMRDKIIAALDAANVKWEVKK